MPRQRTERGLVTAPIRRTPSGAVADLVNIGPGVHLYVRADGGVNLNGSGDGYPFKSPVQFLRSMAELVERLQAEAARSVRAAASG